VDAWVLGYLALPNLIFLAGWLRPEYGVPAMLVMLVSVWSLCRRGAVAVPATRVLTYAFVAALAWVLLSGIGHFVYANSDWIVRDAVLLDLVREEWPVVYRNVINQGDLLLRAPLGLYLPAALAGKIFGLQMADIALFGWCLIGVTLAVYLVVRNAASPREVLGRLLVFVLFSGMDGLGSVIQKQLPTIASHMEWWAGLFQYSSMTTQLFWVPNHALPGWIAIAWLLGCKRGALPVGLSIAIVACVPLWSPLTAIGLAPLFAFAILRDARINTWRVVDGLRVLFHPAAVLVAVITCGLIFPYLLIDGRAMPSTMSFEGLPASSYWVRYVQFVLIEFLVLGLLMLRHFRKDPMLIAALLFLTVLPMFKFGPYNDLVMRASIPALTVLAIRLGDWFAPLWAGKHATDDGEDHVASLAMMIFAIGVLTPALELSRVLVATTWQADLKKSVVVATGGNAPHYLAPADQPWARKMLRQRPP